MIASVGNRTALGKTLGEALGDLYPGSDFSGVVLPPIVTDGDLPVEEPAEQPDDTGEPSVAETPDVTVGELTPAETQQLIDELADLRRRQDEILQRLLEQLEN